MENKNIFDELLEQYREVEKEELERDIEFNKSELNDCKAIVEKFEALKRLEENNDWKAFKDMYFKDEKDRIASALTSTQRFREEAENQLQQKLMSIRHLKMFLENIEIQATTNEQFVDELEDRVKTLENIYETLYSAKGE